MAWVDSPIERSLNITVIKRASDGSSSNIFLDGVNAFGTTSGLTETQFKQLSDSDFDSRVTAFKAYLLATYDTTEAGLCESIDWSGATRTIGTLPTVIITEEITSASEHSAVVPCQVTDIGSSAVSDRGVCFSSTNFSPTHPKTSSGFGIGVYTTTITSLVVGTTYYIRAYATNETGTAYSTTEIYKHLGMV